MWIRNQYKLDVPLTPVLTNLFKEAEELDTAGSMEYFAVADAIDVLCKQYRTSGFFSQENWDDVCRKYPGDEVL